MYKSKSIPLLFCTLLITGCASVAMESTEKSNQAKKFNNPPANSAGLYVYRKGQIAPQSKKDIILNGECLGESANNTFFYKEVTAPASHVIATESEFSPNVIEIYVEAGKNYFIKQFIKIGLFVPGAGLALVDEDTGKNAVTKISLAKSGNCSK